MATKKKTKATKKKPARRATKAITTAVVFSNKAGKAVGTVALAGAASAIHRSPTRIKELMDLLDLPKGTDATVFAKASSVIVR